MEGEELEQIEQEARTLGWKPKEEFSGPDNAWVDAETFVQKGRQIVPILRANNERLNKTVLTQNQKIDNLEKLLKDSQSSIEALEKHYTAANKRAVETAKRQLVAQIKEARENGDTDAEFDLLEQLDAVKESARAAEKADKDKSDAGQSSKKVDPEPEIDPATKRFQEENSWFGQDKKRTKAILRIAEDLRDEGNTTQGYEFMQECLELLKRQEGSSSSSNTRATSKVEGSNRSAGSRQSGSKSFSDLPEDAKKACWSDVEVLVGPNKRYKTKADWEKAYAEIYYGAEQ